MKFAIVLGPIRHRISAEGLWSRQSEVRSNCYYKPLGILAGRRVSTLVSGTLTVYLSVKRVKVLSSKAGVFTMILVIWTSVSRYFLEFPRLCWPLIQSDTKTSYFFADKLADSCDSFDVDDGHSYSWPALDHLVHGDDTTSLSGNSLSPSSSIMQTFYEDKEKDVRIGINHFNRSGILQHYRGLKPRLITTRNLFWVMVFPGLVIRHHVRSLFLHKQPAAMPRLFFIV